MNWEMDQWLRWALVLAGAGQLLLCLASPAIPLVLGWREKVSVLPKLLRQIFWTYACYVLGAHVVFGVLSVFRPMWLLERTGMAMGVSGFIAAWWGVRLVLHWTTFDTEEVMSGPWTRVAEICLGLLFLGLTCVYVLVFIYNWGGGR